MPGSNGRDFQRRRVGKDSVCERLHDAELDPVEQKQGSQHCGESKDGAERKEFFPAIVGYGQQDDLKIFAHHELPMLLAK